MLAATESHWIELLSGNPDRTVVSLVSGRELREAMLEIGERPTNWALQVGEELAEKVGGQLPKLGQASAALTTLRSAMQSAVLGMLIAIRLGSVRGDSMSEESGDSIRVSVESGIELGTVLAAVRRGHALLVERLMQECRALAHPDEHTAQFALISEICFEFVGRLADGLTRLYDQEQRVWINNPRSERLALVTRILQGVFIPQLAGLLLIVVLRSPRKQFPMRLVIEQAV